MQRVLRGPDAALDGDYKMADNLLDDGQVGEALVLIAFTQRLCCWPAEGQGGTKGLLPARKARYPSSFGRAEAIERPSASGGFHRLE